MEKLGNSSEEKIMSLYAGKALPTKCITSLCQAWDHEQHGPSTLYIQSCQADHSLMVSLATLNIQCRRMPQQSSCLGVKE